MLSKQILELYNQVADMKKVDFYTMIEERLDLLLQTYKDDLQDNFDKLQNYDYLDVIKEINKNAGSH